MYLYLVYKMVKHNPIYQPNTLIWLPSLSVYSIDILAILLKKKTLQKAHRKKHIIHIYMRVIYHLHILTIYVVAFAKSNIPGFSSNFQFPELGPVS